MRDSRLTDQRAAGKSNPQPFAHRRFSSDAAGNGSMLFTPKFRQFHKLLQIGNEARAQSTLASSIIQSKKLRRTKK